VEVKSIRAANIKKTHEKLKAQIENRKYVDKENINISINAANRVFGELMESSIKKSLSIKPAGNKSRFTTNEKNSFSHYGDRRGLGARASRYGGSLEMNNIMNRINETPDIRVNKANDILSKIKEGTYETDYFIIADKLLSHDMVMRI
jgi:anti-sigma28 factor (negative regulator of flagellin synthesis)